VLGFLSHIFFDEPSRLTTNLKKQPQYDGGELQPGSFPLNAWGRDHVVRTVQRTPLKGKPMNPGVNGDKFLLCLGTSWLLWPQLSCTNLNDKLKIMPTILGIHLQPEESLLWTIPKFTWLNLHKEFSKLTFWLWTSVVSVHYTTCRHTCGRWTTTFLP